MATAQMHRNKVNSVALPSRVATETQSLILVKRLLAVSVSCITYLRGLFPEYAYGTRYLDDICVKILREDKSCPGSTQLVKWMLGCYDALQKKYLRMVMLAIYTDPEDPQTVTECYQFKFKYTASGPVMDFVSNNSNSVSTCSDAKKTSILLIRKLYILMQNLGPLPNDVCLTMKLFYYDEVTPADYQPPGFKEGTCEGLMFEGEPMYLNVGEVATPFHVLKVKVTTEKERMENIEKSIFKKQASKQPQTDEEKPDLSINDDLAQDNNGDRKRDDIETLKVEDLNLTCQEDGNLQSDDSQNSALADSQEKTSQAAPPAFGRKTRSGRIFQKPDLELKNQKESARASKGNQQARKPEKRSQSFEITGSQEDPAVAKRRKFSEPRTPLN
ncbi:HORMA domain-containing protein 1 [Xenopus laevis]|uniref:HORMA domain-containing protein 1 n=1 Tax=Xenopus laevis TaxID=8355 RepID=HORM1_XENLA|nr:HORMA domain-containing protein 1 [Xenopus laevis]Q5M7C8.1 RecName: Full=HORMA domain-containing protein 1 [Xenopus laevis]AAH88705.1 LOC496240 protein [Xenopus laevis]